MSAHDVWLALWLACWLIVGLAFWAIPNPLRRLSHGDEERFQRLLRRTVLTGMAAAIAAVPFLILAMVTK